MTFEELMACRQITGLIRDNVCLIATKCLKNSSFVEIKRNQKFFKSFTDYIKAKNAITRKSFPPREKMDFPENQKFIPTVA